MTAIRLTVACAGRPSAGLIGVLAVPRAGFTTWYATLQKPAFTPPSWVFGPAWTVLYLLMGIAAFLVWQEGLHSNAVRIALVWYLVQLVLNALWSPVFFGFHQIGWSLVVIVLLWAALIVTMRYFLQISRPAGVLLVPYLTCSGSLSRRC